MKKLALVLAVVMVLSLGLTACGGSTSSTGTASSAPAGSSSSGSASDAAPAYNPDALQVKALDDNTLQVTLTARTPYFLELTAFPAYAPVQQATVEANGEAWAVDAATYIGNGPYKIAEWVPSSHITMVKNENYWNVDSLAGPDTLQFTLMEDDAAQLTAFQSGELDFIDAVPNDEIDALSSTPEFHKEGQIGTYYVSYNTQAAPFDDPLVRQAFTLAVDRDYICKQIGKSGQIPAGAFVSEGLSDALPSAKWAATIMTRPPGPTRPIWPRPRSCWLRPAIPTARACPPSPICTTKAPAISRSARRCSRCGASWAPQ